MSTSSRHDELADGIRSEVRRLRAEAAALGREHASLAAQHAALVLEKARQVSSSIPGMTAYDEADIPEFKCGYRGAGQGGCSFPARLMRGDIPCSKLERHRERLVFAVRYVCCRKACEDVRASGKQYWRTRSMCYGVVKSLAQG